eukprot:8656015-Lingulodinium_polyedra.AAC.1
MTYVVARESYSIATQNNATERDDASRRSNATRRKTLPRGAKQRNAIHKWGPRGHGILQTLQPSAAFRNKR